MLKLFLIANLPGTAGILPARKLNEGTTPAGCRRSRVKALHHVLLPLLAFLLLTTGCTSTHCLNARQAGNAILDESLEPYYSQLQRREIATLTGEPATGDTLEECQDQARERFRTSMLSFTRQEKKAITWATRRIDKDIAEHYPVFASQPWRFIKSHNRLCGGWSYTRGRSIILSQRTLDRIVKQHRELDEKKALRAIAPLFIHEQMHVIQRLDPERFVSLYTDVFGLVKGDVQPSDWITTNQISNPDGIRNEWSIALPSAAQPERYFWRRTILKEADGVPRMGRDFKEVVVELKRAGDQFTVIEEDGLPVFHPQSETVSHFDDRFPNKNGVDHPNELSAYMFQKLILTEHLHPPEPDTDKPPHPITVQFKEWCRDNL